MGLADIFIASLIFAAMVGVLLVYTQGKSPLAPHRPFIIFFALLWFLFGLVHVEVTEAIFSIEPADAVRHVRIGKELAYSLEDGRWGEVWRYAQKLGNYSFRVYLGSFYYITKAGEVSTVLVHVFLAFWGSLALFSMIVSIIEPSRVPWLRLIFMVFMPSLVFWTTANIKEGIMFWCICNILVASTAPKNNRGFASKWLAIISIVVGGILRPHIMLIWIVAIAFVLVWERGRKVWGALMLISAYPALLVLDAMTGFGLSVEGAWNVMENNAQAIGNLGTASGISASSSESFILFSGFAVLFLRPYPWEVISFAQAVTALETWIVFLSMVLVWLRLGPKLRRKARQMPIVRISFLVCLLFCVLFGRLGNIGLAARQRLQLLPAVIVLIAVPWLLLRRKAQEDRARAQNLSGR